MLLGPGVEAEATGTRPLHMMAACGHKETATLKPFVGELQPRKRTDSCALLLCAGVLPRKNGRVMRCRGGDGIKRTALASTHGRGRMMVLTTEYTEVWCGAARLLPSR